MSRPLSMLLREAARRTPAALALLDGDRALSYEELDREADAVADRLLSLEIGRGDRVGLWIDKSAAAVAAVHGILRSGAAYVPLDPRAPVPRIASIVRDCELSTLVTASGRPGDWSALTEAAPLLAQLVLADRPDELPDAPDEVLVVDLPAGDPPRVPDPVQEPDDLAYILYTSGSTGQPKGVMLTHRNGWAFVDWTVRTLRVTATDRLCSHAPFHFDLSIFDLFASASTGAPLALVPRGATVFPVEAVRFAESSELTIWYSVPSALAMMVAKGDLRPGRLETLRAIVFAGEVFPTPSLATLMELVPHPEYWNWYGPTETNVCTAYRVPEAPDPDGPPIPIGDPIDVVETAILDESRAPVPLSAEGELLVRGPTVSPGYWGDPHRTVERFVTHDGRGGWYRTGDVVAAGPDGLRFQGRRDHQIKSRGHRIELGEIEAALHRHPEVEQAVVVAVPDPLITNRLRAFAQTSATGAELVAHCKRLLPSYMVPEEVEVLDALPLTSTGKVDRQALERQRS